MTNDIDISDLIKQVRNATIRHAGAKDLVDEARREETTALNVLNEAQRLLDQKIEDLKKQAPKESDWRREDYQTND